MEVSPATIFFYFENAHQDILNTILPPSSLINFNQKGEMNLIKYRYLKTDTQVNITRNCSHLCNNLETIEKKQLHFGTLLYVVITTINTSHQFCSLFPSSTAMLFSTRRNKLNKLRICAPSQTKCGALTFYSPPAYCNHPHLLPRPHSTIPEFIQVSFCHQKVALPRQD